MQNGKIKIHWLPLAVLLLCLLLTGCGSNHSSAQPKDIMGTPTAEPSAGTTEPEVTVYVTVTGSKYHLKSCKHVSKSRIPISLEEARKKYGRCSVCRPPR